MVDCGHLQCFDTMATTKHRDLESTRCGIYTWRYVTLSLRPIPIEESHSRVDTLWNVHLEVSYKIVESDPETFTKRYIAGSYVRCRISEGQGLRLAFNANSSR